jgi:hypothetical protein
LPECSSADRTSDVISLQLDSVLLTPWPAEETKHSFDLSQLHAGEEVVVSGHTIHREQNNTRLKMGIVLTFEQRDPMLMSCSWSELKSA